MLEVLDWQGLVQYVSHGTPRQAEVILRRNENEVSKAIEDSALLGSILEDVACIAN